MGVLRYGSRERLYAFDDRTLAHLAVAIIEELRRGEAFSFSFDGEEGPTTLVVSRHVPLRFDFDTSMPVSINGEWVRALEDAAHTVHGLGVLAEPARIPRAS